MRRLFGPLAVAALAAPLVARADLPGYLKKDDPSFAWTLKSSKPGDKVDVDVLALTSQTWMKAKWEHELVVYRPAGTKPGTTVFLWNTGGTPKPLDALVAGDLVRRTGIPVAFLYGIPSQPLFGGKKEDALIAETFVQFLDTQDADWPLLFPMVKSVVRAMDAIQAFAKQEWKADVKDFVVSGASKRGWTAWLTAASGRAGQGHRPAGHRHAEHEGAVPPSSRVVRQAERA